MKKEGFSTYGSQRMVKNMNRRRTIDEICEIYLRNLYAREKQASYAKVLWQRKLAKALDIGRFNQRFECIMNNLDKAIGYNQHEETDYETEQSMSCAKRDAPKLAKLLKEQFVDVIEWSQPAATTAENQQTNPTQ